MSQSLRWLKSTLILRSLSEISMICLCRFMRWQQLMNTVVSFEIQLSCL